MNLAHYKDVLVQAGVSFEPGLSQDEIQGIQERYKFKFPPDLRDFLTFALPVSNGFLNWRNATQEEIVNRMAWPYDGICFDIEHRVFWPEAWGERPSSIDEAFVVAKKAVDAAPTLIPIFSHRYIPDRPREPGNPVFSVYQTDIIYYGCDLADYLQNEFRYYFGRREHQLDGDIKRIEFWSWLVEDSV
jgi:hypothetical protein